MLFLNLWPLNRAKNQNTGINPCLQSVSFQSVQNPISVHHHTQLRLCDARCAGTPPEGGAVVQEMYFQTPLGCFVIETSLLESRRWVSAHGDIFQVSTGFPSAGPEVDRTREPPSGRPGSSSRPAQWRSCSSQHSVTSRQQWHCNKTTDLLRTEIQ